jgi:hypothetical protein
MLDMMLRREKRNLIPVTDAYEVASHSLYSFYIFSNTTANTLRNYIVKKNLTVKLAVAECIEKILL